MNLLPSASTSVEVWGESIDVKTRIHGDSPTVANFKDRKTCEIAKLLWWVRSVEKTCEIWVIEQHSGRRNSTQLSAGQHALFCQFKGLLTR